jgi:hypothetical protein
MADRNSPSDNHSPGPFHAPLMVNGPGGEGLGISGPFALLQWLFRTVSTSPKLRADGIGDWP